MDRELDLAYFAGLLDDESRDLPANTAGMWDRRADEWEKDYSRRESEQPVQTGQAERAPGLAGQARQLRRATEQPAQVSEQALQPGQPGQPGHSQAEQAPGMAEQSQPPPGQPEQQRGSDRVQVAVDFLRSHGLPGPDDDVIDIGCGLGRFAAAFAQSARHVTGIDISENMIRYAAGFAQREGIDNITFLVRDFQAMDLVSERFVGGFDLVFSSLSSAAQGMEGLEKMLRICRKYCCYISHIRSENELESRMMREIFGRERPDPWARNGRSYYAMYNVLYLMGYTPEATSNTRRQEKIVFFDEDRIRLFMRQMLDPIERTEENERRITAWARTNDKAGRGLTEISEVRYGRLFWDVRDRRDDQADAGGGPSQAQ